MSEYLKNFDDAKTNSFFLEDEKLLKKYSEIRNEIKNVIGKKFGSDPVFNDKYLTVKIKSYNNKIITINFHGKPPTEGIKCVCLWAIVIGFALTVCENIYPQPLLEESR